MSLDDLPELASLRAVREAKAIVRRGPRADKLTRAEELRLQLADLLEENHVARHDSSRLAKLLLSLATSRHSVVSRGPKDAAVRTS